MNVFDFLLTNEAHLAHRLTNTAKHYSDWTLDRVFEETKRVLDGLKCNFKKENALISTIRHVEDMEDVIEEAEQHRKDIRSAADNLCMIHVDEPGFEQGLEDLASKFEQHRMFCENILFPLLEEHADPDELQRIADQLDALVLDG